MTATMCKALCYSARQNGPSYCALLSFLNAIFPFGEEAYFNSAIVTVNHVALYYSFIIIFIMLSYEFSVTLSPWLRS